MKQNKKYYTNKQKIEHFTAKVKYYQERIAELEKPETPENTYQDWQSTLKEALEEIKSLKAKINAKESA